MTDSTTPEHLVTAVPVLDDATVRLTRVRDDVYSNHDHQLDRDVMLLLAADSNRYAQHSAFDFCGYIMHTPDGWREDVWVRHFNVASYMCDDLPTLIAHVVETHGDR
jgi:hypothetical protein